MLATQMAHECFIEWSGFQSFKFRDFFATAKRKRSGGKQTSSDDAEPDNNEEIAEEFASLTDEHMLEKASVDVQSEISGIKHPVMYESTTFAKWRLKINLYFSRLRRSGKCASILKSHLTQETPNQLWLGKKWSKIAHSRKSKIIHNASFKQSFRYNEIPQLCQ